ncbi:MAG TPA: site-2 protease family protein [bacterium]|mgnify:CR=1 FL=1|nr:site-2 protease family protein [bacterium]
MFENPVQGIFAIFALFLGATMHEYAHGQVADWLGDDTPRQQGRLTINPIPHIDLFGSILLPALLYFASGFFFAYAKPVQVNPMNFRNPRRGMLYCSLAGPAANLIIAIAAALLLHGLAFAGNLGLTAVLSEQFFGLLLLLAMMMILVNLILALFNLIPIPPLDGSKVVMHFLPLELAMRYARLAPFGFIILLVLINTPLLNWYYGLVLMPLFHLLTGGLG